MTRCSKCDDNTEYEWFENFQGKWRLGLKLDINNYRPHKCSSPQKEEKPSNKRNWNKFTCEKCGMLVKQNLKLVKTTSLNYCLECDNQ